MYGSHSSQMTAMFYYANYGNWGRSVFAKCYVPNCRMLCP